MSDFEHVMSGATLLWSMMPIEVLPVREGSVRFAVGKADGLCSNSWKVWANPKGDVYLACRDGFRDAKVSLHTSGRWRMAFTEEACRQNPKLRDIPRRAWDVWDEPPPTVPNIVAAFRLRFPISELAVRPDQRTGSIWKAKDMIFIEPLPPESLTTVSLFVTNGDLPLRHESEPSLRLASLDIGNGRFAQVVVHGDPVGDFPVFLERAVANASQQARARGVELPETAFGYIFGTSPDQSRFLVGARMTAR